MNGFSIKLLFFIVITYINIVFTLFTLKRSYKKFSVNKNDDQF